MSAALTFSRVGVDDVALFDALVVIYAASIEASERKTVGMLRAMLGNPAYRFTVARDGAGGEVVGFSIVYCAARFGLLEYLAVAPGRRSAGVGTGLFRECVAAGPLPLLVEVDVPRDETGGRRVRFYRRVGCRVVEELRYVLPLGKGPPEMMLMVWGGGEALRVAELRRYLTTIYVECYGCRADDPRIGRMVEGLGDPVRLV